MSVAVEQTARLGFWVALAGSFFAWAPATFPGYWQALEGYVPVFNAVHAGALASVATTPDLWRGTGRAAYLLIQPLILLGFTPVSAVRAVFAVSFILGGLGIYAWLRQRLGDRAAGLTGLIYMLLPPVLATVYVRGSLSDALVLGLLPLALAGTASYADSRSPSAAGVVVLCLLWVWRIQAGLACFVTLLLLAYVWLVERSRMALLVVALTAAAGLASLIPLWSVQGPAPVVFEEHFLYIAQLLYGQWQTAPSIPGWQDGYPFQLGFAALAFGLAALWLWRLYGAGWRGTVQHRLLAFSVGGALLLLALSLNVSAPLWRWSGAQRLLTYPWQIVLPAAPLLAAVAGSLPALNSHLRRAPIWLALAALVILSSYDYLSADYTQVLPSPAPVVSVIGPNQEIVLLNATLIEQPVDHPVDSTLSATAALTATLDITWQALRPLPVDYNIFFQAVTGEVSEETVVAQLDVQPDAERPATSWRPGEIFQAQYTLTLEPDDLAAPGGVRYYFGYYDWRDGARLPVDGGIDDKLVFHGPLTSGVQEDGVDDGE